MKFTKKDLLILIIPLLIAAVVYPFLPDQIPRQLGANGEVRYASKELIFLIGLVPFVVYKFPKSKRR